MEYDDSDLNRVIGRSIRQLEQKRRQYMDSSLQGTGLHGPMYRCLLFLARNPGSSQDQLAEHQHTDKANIARIARKLEDLGYIVRRQDEDNRRQYQIDLTDRGAALVPRIRQCLHAWNAALVAGISVEEEEALIRLLRRMQDNTEAL